MTTISARESALNALARREHSQQELKQKLLAKGYELEVVDGLLKVLQAEHLQSDQRFAESYVNARVEAGFGPATLRAALRDRGIDGELIQQVIPEDRDFWDEVISRVWEKKYRGQKPKDRKDYARQLRFLLQRGFFSEQVRRFLSFPQGI